MYVLHAVFKHNQTTKRIIRYHNQYPVLYCICSRYTRLFTLPGCYYHTGTSTTLTRKVSTIIILYLRCVVLPRKYALVPQKYIRKQHGFHTCAYTRILIFLNAHVTNYVRFFIVLFRLQCTCKFNYQERSVRGECYVVSG
jgi:hypothetical protein